MSFDPIKSATEMVKKVRVSTVLSSLLWILPFLFAGLVVVSFTDNITVQIFFMWAIGFTLAVFLLSFIGILIWGDKKFLQSEHHIFMMRALEVLGDQQHTYKDFKSSTLENNPSLPKPETADSLSIDKIEKQEHE
ncbi:MAG: hypothetical protein WC735_00610 [Candidatus Paceibacterota bacterium]|jgi:hypothetical protein